MDRALVHSASAVKEFDYLLDPLGRWIFNIPFEAVPEGFINQLRDCSYSYEQFKKLCPVLNELPSYWNLALVNDKDEILVILWGNYDPLEKIMQVLRISARPDVFKFNGQLLERIIDLLKTFALALGLEKVYWVTDRWQAYLRKVSGVAKLSNARVMEVY